MLPYLYRGLVGMTRKQKQYNVRDLSEFKHMEKILKRNKKKNKKSSSPA
jgi:hypothetical protein